MAGKGTITYTYDAVGNKLRKQTVEGSKTTTTLYGGSIVYENDTLQFISHEEGRTRVNNNNYVFDYYLKDHLGNVRMTITDDNTASSPVIDATSYYPFGLVMSGISSKAAGSLTNKYKFGGKELQSNEFSNNSGLEMYDFGARNYDQQIGRWHTVDPKASEFKSYSPYNFCLNNPVRLIDPDGQAPEDPIGPGYYSASINSRYIGFGLRHPIASLRIGFGVTKGATDISTNATRFATRGEVLYGSKRGQKDEGSENGAYRHTLWQSSITSEFGSKTAKEAGNAHEENPFTSLKDRSFKSMADADQTVDLLNNIIGRGIGEANRGAGMDDLANLVLDEFKNNGLYTASKDKNGNWNISKTKLSSEKYDQLKGIIKGLNENGRTANKQKTVDDRSKKDAQSWDRGPKW